MTVGYADGALVGSLLGVDVGSFVGSTVVVEETGAVVGLVDSIVVGETVSAVLEVLHSDSADSIPIPITDYPRSKSSTIPSAGRNTEDTKSNKSSHCSTPFKYKSTLTIS